MGRGGRFVRSGGDVLLFGSTHSFLDRQERRSHWYLSAWGGRWGGGGGEGAGLRSRLSASLPTLSGGGSGAAGVWVLGKRHTGSAGTACREPRRSDDARKNLQMQGRV